MPLFEKLVAGLESANLTADELRQLQQIAPNLGPLVDTVLSHKLSKLKTCTTAEKAAIATFIEHIGYEITPAQPDEDTLRSLQAVPSFIEKSLTELMPFAHAPLLECLKNHAIPNTNLNEISRWCDALNTAFTGLARTKPSRLQERFFKQVFKFTDQVGLDFASEGLNMMKNDSLTIDEVQSFFEELVAVQQTLLKRKRSYEPMSYHPDDILAQLATKQSSFLPLLEAREASQHSQIESDQPNESEIPSFCALRRQRQTASQ